MIQIAYKNAAKEIVSLFHPPKGWTLGDLKADLDRTNETHGGGIRAYIVPVRAASAQGASA